MAFLWVEKYICKEKIIKTTLRAQGFSENWGEKAKRTKKEVMTKALAFHRDLGHNKPRRCTFLRMTT
jgi:hypothetical protein